MLTRQQDDSSGVKSPFHRTRILTPTPTWWLTTINNSNSQDPVPSSASQEHCIRVGKTPKHSK